MGGRGRIGRSWTSSPSASAERAPLPGDASCRSCGSPPGCIRACWGSAVSSIGQGRARQRELPRPLMPLPRHLMPPLRLAERVATMPQADVVVVGAGLAGMTAAIALADAGARVEVVARGHAATHWTAGGMDIAAPAGSETSAKGVKRLARQDRPPYPILGEGLPAALTALRSALATEGLDFRGDLADPLHAIPTAIGGTRRAAILPTAQANALAPWQSSERLVVCG